MNVKSPRGAVPYLFVNGLIRSPLTYQLTHKTYQKLVIKFKKKYIWVYLLLNFLAGCKICTALSLTHRCNNSCMGCSFNCILKVGVEESIVNAPRITDHGSAI
jgi:hypothetical protein